MAKYWFAHFKQLRREDFGWRSSGIAAADLLRDRIFLGPGLLLLLRYSRPISAEGIVVVLLSIALMVAGLAGIALLTVNANQMWGFAIVGWVLLVAVGYDLIVLRTADPTKSVEEYNTERDEIASKSVKAPWLRWPYGGKDG